MADAGVTFLILMGAFAVACLLGLVLAPLMEVDDDNNDNDKS